MRIFALIAAVAAAAPACAATVIPVPPVPGSTQTFAVSINDRNQVSGYFVKPDGGGESFFGTLDGQYTTFDADPIHAPGSVARGISDNGYISGTANTNQSDPLRLVEYERLPSGAIEFVTDRRTLIHGVAGGIDNHHKFAVENRHEDGGIDGFIGRDGKVKTKIDLGFPAFEVRPRGLTKHYTAGYFSVASGAPSQGFLSYESEPAAVVDYPGAEDGFGTQLQGVNKFGTAVGFWIDENSNEFAFIYDPETAKFKPLTVPGYVSTAATSINDRRLVTLQAWSADLAQSGSFVYCPLRRKECPAVGIEVPDAGWIAAKPWFKPHAYRGDPAPRSKR